MKNLRFPLITHRSRLFGFAVFLVLCWGLGEACTPHADDAGRTGTAGTSLAGERAARIDALPAVLFDSLSSNPAFVCREVERLLHEVTDSMTFYSFRMLQAKAYQLRSMPDSVDYFTQQTEAYCRRMASRTHEALAADKMVAENLPAALSDLWGEACNQRGNLWIRQGRADSAVYAYHRSLQARLKGVRHHVLPDVTINLADACSQLGQYDQAARWYRRSLVFADSLGVPETERFPQYYGLATVYTHLRDFAQADAYFALARRYFDRMEPYEKHFYLNNRGNSYYYREDYPKALTMFRQMLALAAEHPEMVFEKHLTELNMGETFLLMNQTDSAEHYLHRCSGFFHRIGNETALYYLDTQLIELALKQQNLPLARQRLAQAVKPAHVDPTMLHIRNRYLQHYFEQSGNFKEAYHYQKLNQHIDDSIRNERVRMRTAELALKYQQDTTLMRQKIFIQQKENEVLALNQREYLWISICLGIALLTAFGYFYYRKQRILLQLQNRNQVASLRLENIRNRVSPHFIFNVLNRQMGNFNDEQAQQMHGLVKLMRRNLEITEQLCVSLEEELDFVRTYVDLERQSLRPDFVYHLEVGPSIDLSQTLIPSMWLQIPVENAIKHALRDKTGPQHLWVSVQRENEGVLIRVTDNGGGFRVQSVRRGTGTGMRVIRQTLQLLNAQNRRPLELKVTNVTVETGETGCQVRIFLPDGYDFSLK